MPFSLKQILIFVVSALIFAGAVYLVDTELLDFVQARFYNPSVINSVTKENSRDAQLVQSHISELQLKFASSLGETAVRNSFMHNQDAEDIFERSRIFGILMESTAGLQSVQFVDSNGVRIHYSTSARDVLSQSRDSTAYRNYNENAYVLPFEMVSVPSDGGSKFLMDEYNDRIIFSYPFRDSLDVHRGTALFTVSIRALAERLIAEGSLQASDTVSLIRMPPGIVLGTPDTSKTEILNKAASIWSSGILDTVTLDAEDSGVEFALISSKTSHGIFLGRIVNNSIFTIPEYMKIILLLSIFLTFYLVVFFLANLKPDPAILVQNRINKLRKNLFERLEAENLNRSKFVFELEQRRDEIHRELKQKLKLSRSKEKKLDAMIDRSWNELLAEITIESDYAAPAVYAKSGKPKEPKDVDKIEEIEEIGDADEIEEAGAIDEAEAIDEVDEIEEIEEIDEVEAIDEIGEAEDIDEIEEIEEIGELGEAEEIDEIEEIEEIEEAQELEEIGEAEDIEELEDIEEIEEIEEIDDVEEIEEVGEAEEIESEPEPYVKIVPKKRSLLERAQKLDLSALPPADAQSPEEIAGWDIEEAEELLAIDDAAPAASTPPRPQKAGRGLLARADTTNQKNAGPDVSPDEERETPHTSKGLLALASEIEFNHNIPAGTDESADDLIKDVEIVSPFDSMFTGLDE